ncbi:MAG TPA: DUF5590 domain-containing protein [Tetragenococcus sp.]|nr:DUF5590 domain-containing protein [Tetragenococcus sp.]
MSSESKKEKRKTTGLFITGVILLLLIFFSTIFYIRSSRPMRQAKKEAVSIAEKTAKIKTVDDFYYFTRGNTYFTVSGKNDKKEELLVVIPKSGKNVTTYKQDDGITQEEAEQLIAKKYPEETITKSNFGMYEKKAIWEVVTSANKQNNYYLLQFKNGKIVKEIRSI